MNTAAIQPSGSADPKVSIRFDGWEFRHAMPRISEGEFEDICRKNPDLRIELDKNGNLLVKPPVSLGSGNFEIETGADLVMWNRAARLGMVFSSQTMFSLPDGAKRMADVAWVSNDKLKTLPQAEWDTYARIVPDFVIEVRSPSDELAAQQDKIKGVWLANGVRLAWLFDPAKRPPTFIAAMAALKLFRVLIKYSAEKACCRGLCFRWRCWRGDCRGERRSAIWKCRRFDNF